MEGRNREFLTRDLYMEDWLLESDGGQQESSQWRGQSTEMVMQRVWLSTKLKPESNYP